MFRPLRREMEEAYYGNDLGSSCCFSFVVVFGVGDYLFTETEKKKAAVKH